MLIFKQFFSVEYLDKYCSNSNLFLKKGDKIYVKVNEELNIKTKQGIFELLIDYSSEDLEKVKKWYIEKMK